MTKPSWVDTCKLPFLDRQAIRETDPIKCAQAIQRFADLSIYESTVGTESFCHRSSVQHLGQCSIAALAHPAMRIVYGMDNALVNSLSFPFRGVNRTKLAKDSLEIRPGQGLFRPITNEALVETGDYIGISLLAGIRSFRIFPAETPCGFVPPNHRFLRGSCPENPDGSVAVSNFTR